uniref:Putative ovule protein n=1 Tax=Solanum chacoense TaxID=4108 RepID=A0A0V0GP66_SOLCH
MEGLNNMIKTAKLRGWIKGFEVAREGIDSLEVTHLQYADDTLTFCDAEEDQLKHLRLILVLFEGRGHWSAYQLEKEFNVPY